MKEAHAIAESEAIPTIVEAGTSFDGLVSFHGAVRVAGRVVGKVVTDGTFWLAEEGQLKGRVEADHVLVAGDFEGEIEARRRIDLLPTARVRGRLSAPCLVVADGSCFDGQCAAGTLRAQAALSSASASPAPAPVLALESIPITA